MIDIAEKRRLAEYAILEAQAMDGSPGTSLMVRQGITILALCDEVERQQKRWSDLGKQLEEWVETDDLESESQFAIKFVLHKLMADLEGSEVCVTPVTTYFGPLPSEDSDD